MLAAFNGHEPLTFPDYLDAETGKTLTAEPGGVYDVTPASGRSVPDVPAGWFTPALRPRSGAWIGVSRELTGKDAAEGDSTPETGSDEEAADGAAGGEDPETDTPQQS